MIKCGIISGLAFSEVEIKTNRFLSLRKVEKIIQVVNLSDEKCVAVAIYYEATESGKGEKKEE